VQDQRSRWTGTSKSGGAGSAQPLDRHVKARKPLPDPKEQAFEDYRTSRDQQGNTSFMTM
jgi:hypothetical protein